MATLEEILAKPRTFKQLQKELGISKHKVRKLLKDLERNGYLVKETTSRKNKRGEHIHGKKYYQITGYIPRTQSRAYEIDVDKFAVVSDTHLGSKYAKLEELIEAYDMIDDAGIKHVFHAGDITDGVEVYPGQIADLLIWGVEAQAKYVGVEYPYKNDITTHFITGNHDTKSYTSKGADVGTLIASMRKDLHYLGQYFASIQLKPQAELHLTHPEGGIPYALSYPLQKYLRNAPPSTYPDMLVAGHLHTSYFTKYQDVFNLQAGCFMGTTDWLRRKGIQSTPGFWIVEPEYFDAGIRKLKMEWIDF